MDAGVAVRPGPGLRACACHRRRLRRGASPSSVVVVAAPLSPAARLSSSSSSAPAHGRSAEARAPAGAAMPQLGVLTGARTDAVCAQARRVFVTTTDRRGSDVALALELPGGRAAVAADVHLPRIAVAASDGSVFLFETPLPPPPPSELFFGEDGGGGGAAPQRLSVALGGTDAALTLQGGPRGWRAGRQGAGGRDRAAWIGGGPSGRGSAPPTLSTVAAVVEPFGLRSAKGEMIAATRRNSLSSSSSLAASLPASRDYGHCLCGYRRQCVGVAAATALAARWLLGRLRVRHPLACE